MQTIVFVLFVVALCTIPIVGILATKQQKAKKQKQKLIEERDYYRARVYRFPDATYRYVATPIGTIMTMLRGGDTLTLNYILVFLPVGFGYDHEIAKAFRAAAKNRYTMHMTADNPFELVRAADAYVMSGSRLLLEDDLDRVTALLKQIIAYPKGVTVLAKPPAPTE